MRVRERLSTTSGHTVTRGRHMTCRLLTARQVADLLGVSAETVLRWIRRGDLPAIRLPGGAVRFREADLDDWLEERATPRRGVLPPASAARRLRYPRATYPQRRGELNARDPEWPGLPARPEPLGPSLVRRPGKRRRKSPFPSKSAALAHYRDVIEPELRGEPGRARADPQRVRRALPRAPRRRGAAADDRDRCASGSASRPAPSATCRCATWNG